jgi:NTE family protein
VPVDASLKAPDDAAPPEEADGVFQGGGVKGIAFAGALAAAEAAGVRRYRNVAGASAGAITAALLAVGYDAARVQEALGRTNYAHFADFGAGGRLLGGSINYFRLRGFARGEYFRGWLGERLEAANLDRGATFARLARTDLPSDLDESERRRAQYTLKVIASDVTAGRMLILPEDITGYEDESGRALSPDTLPIVLAVRMSMSYPIFFNPVTLSQKGRPHLIVDGGLLSNFPVWLFDAGRARPPKRPTWGFRLHAGAGPDEPPYHHVRRHFWITPLLKAMFLSATEAWDARNAAQADAYARAVSIPTHGIKATDFGLDEQQAGELYDWGKAAATEFFASERVRAYLAEFRRRQRTATRPYA